MQISVDILNEIPNYEEWSQTAYAGFTFYLQNEWQYVQRVVAGIGALFAPLERMIRDHLLRSLVGIPASEMDGDHRILLTHGVKTGGLAVRNPLETAEYALDTSKVMTRHLVSSLVDNDVPFDPNEHRRAVSLASVGARKKRLTRERLVLEERGDVDAATKTRDARACNAGLWLSVYPSHLNSTVLSTNEWRDNVRLRYNHIPLDMPKLCDGCGAHMTVEHALSCKKGGLVSLRHDGVADEWRHLCGCGFTPGRAEREPHIYSSANCTPSVNAGLPTNSNTTPTINPHTTQQPQQLQQRQQQPQQ